MENKEKNIPIPELSEEVLDRASGGGWYTDPYEKKCRFCSGRLTTDEEKRTGVCRNCSNDGLVPGRP